jgi:single-strand DNA-binding protein
MAWGCLYFDKWKTPLTRENNVAARDGSPWSVLMNFNRVILIGRLTRDPEVRTFGSGGKVAAFGFAVTNKKKNQQTGQWEDEPMFIDVDVFNKGEFGTLANIAEQFCRKGSLICLEGRLKLDSWDDKTTGQKRSKHKIVADAIQLLETRAEAEARQHRTTGQRSSSAPPSMAPPPDAGYSDSYPGHDEPSHPSGTTGASEGSGDDIPF